MTGLACILEITYRWDSQPKIFLAAVRAIDKGSSCATMHNLIMSRDRGMPAGYYLRS